MGHTSHVSLYNLRRNSKMNNMIICLGGCGSNIAKLATTSTLLNNLTIYSIDSQSANVDINSVGVINFISILSDEKAGSGRNRQRAQAMYEYHESIGAFEKMYNDAVESKAPVLVITSAAGGTGSGSTVPVCKALIDKGVQVIPVIIFPNKNDPDAFHLNANDLLMELDEVGVETYSIFENRKGDANYEPVNQEVVNLIEIIFGKRYTTTELDSIDDSDLDVILSTPGRFIAVSADATSTTALSKEVTRKVFSGFQPAWTPEQASNHTIITAFSLTSMFANTEFKNVFSEINNRLENVYDEYRNIANDDNDGKSSATVIVAGLPRPEIKEIDGDYKEASSLSEGMKKSKRPNFMNRKKATVVTNDKDSIGKFKWK